MKLLALAITFSLISFAQAARADIAPGARGEIDPMGPRSIADLSTLTNVLIHHYECKADLVLAAASASRAETFSLQPLLKGETGLGKLIEFEGDRLLATATAQMLSLEWTRQGQIVAIAKTMIMDSPMRSYALLAVDPTNPSQRVQLVCNGITFAQLQRAKPAAASAATPIVPATAAVDSPRPIVTQAPAGIYRLDDSLDHSACTTVAISPDGLMLTALHCLRNCLRLQGRMESASSPFIGLTELDIATQPNTPVMCPNLSISELAVSGVRVLATGQSLLQYAPEFLSYTSYFSDLRSRGLDVMNEDFALFQISTPTPDCGRLAISDIQANAPLAALGFQQQVAHSDSLIYDETPGFRYASSQQSAYSHISDQLAGQPEFSAYVKQLFDHADFIYASAPIKEGQSGGPVINDQREIAGLVSGHSTSGAGEGPGVSELFAVPLSHVMDKLPVVLAAELRTKNTLCHSTF